MTITKDPVSRAGSALELLSDINDPTAGSVAISRELASEQVRMIADPAPLGLAAFALTTFLLSLVNAGVMPKDTEPVMLGVALAFGGIAQLLAGMWEFRKGNVFGATVFSSYAPSGCPSGPTWRSTPNAFRLNTTGSRPAGTWSAGPSSPVSC